MRGGVRVRLASQPLKLLALLVRRAGDLVTREEIQNELWTKGSVVDFDHVVNQYIRQLRTVLGDSRDQPRFIETAPRRGYRFVATVSTVGTAGARRAPRNLPSRRSADAAMRRCVAGGVTAPSDRHTAAMARAHRDCAGRRIDSRSADIAAACNDQNTRECPRQHKPARPGRGLRLFPCAAAPPRCRRHLPPKHRRPTSKAATSSISRLSTAIRKAASTSSARSTPIAPTRSPTKAWPIATWRRRPRDWRRPTRQCPRHARWPVRR